MIENGPDLSGKDIFRPVGAIEATFNKRGNLIEGIRELYRNLENREIKYSAFGQGAIEAALKTLETFSDGPDKDNNIKKVFKFFESFFSKDQLQVFKNGVLSEFAVAECFHRTGAVVYYPEKEEDLYSGIDWWMDISSWECQERFLGVQVKSLKGITQLHFIFLDSPQDIREKVLRNLEIGPNLLDDQKIEGSFTNLVDNCNQYGDAKAMVIFLPSLQGEHAVVHGGTGEPLDGLEWKIYDAVLQELSREEVAA